jgi:hypothetical protein
MGDDEPDRYRRREQIWCIGSSPYLDGDSARQRPASAGSHLIPETILWINYFTRNVNRQTLHSERSALPTFGGYFAMGAHA